MARARTGKQWQQFSDPDNFRLFPNIRRLPSRSATPREEHMPFYDKVWPKTDKFWTFNQPSTLWNCKCDWEETNDDVTDGNPTSRIVKPGLDEHPATSGEIFTDTAPYIKGTTGEARSIVEDFKMGKSYMKKAISIDMAERQAHKGCTHHDCKDTTFFETDKIPFYNHGNSRL